MTALLWTVAAFAAVTVAGVVLGKALRAHLDAISVPVDEGAVPVRTCRSCRCTDAQACAGGCSWVSESVLDDDWDLCTACAEWRDAADALAARTGHPSARPSDPRSPGRRALERLGWTLCAAYLLGALGFAGSMDFIAAGGAQ